MQDRESMSTSFWVLVLTITFTKNTYYATCEKQRTNKNKDQVSLSASSQDLVGEVLCLLERKSFDQCHNDIRVPNTAEQSHPCSI